MKITDLPMTGTFSPNEFDHYEWERRAEHPNILFLNKAAECENPHYEADVYFHEGIIDFKGATTWEAFVAAVDQNGGETALDPDYIDQFDPLFDYLFEKYGQDDQIII